MTTRNASGDALIGLGWLVDRSVGEVGVVEWTMRQLETLLADVPGLSLDEA